MRRLAHLLKTGRRARGWSQAELARQLGGYAQTYVGKVERLEGDTAGIDFLESVIRVFGVSPLYFFVPGPDDLDPATFTGPVERQVEALQRHVAALMLAMPREPEPDEDKPGSGPRPLSRPPPARHR